MASPITVQITPATLTELTIVIETSTFIEIRTLADCTITETKITFSLEVPKYDNCTVKLFSTGYRPETIQPSGTSNTVRLTATVDYTNTSDGTNIYYIKDDYSRQFENTLLELVQTKADSGLIPTKTSDLTNDSGFITGITSSDVITALGYTPSNDSDVVKTSGDQSVGGLKTFTKQVTKTNSSAGADTIFVNKNTSITKGTPPSANVDSRWRLTDSSSGDGNSALIGGVNFGYATNMRTSAILLVGKPEANSTTTAFMGIFYPATGDPYTSAPTPETSDNSNKIATTAYVKAQGYATTSYADAITGKARYATSSSAADATEKVVSIPAITSLEVNQCIIVQPTITSTVADSTIKLNNFTAYPMRYNNAAITTSTDSIVWNQNYPSIWMFDGTYWIFIAHGSDSNTTYSTMSVAEGTAGTATTARTMRADYLKQILDSKGYITSADLPTNYVTTDTAQTISETKTFNKAIKAKAGFDVINTDTTKGTNPASTQYWGLFRANDSTDSSTWANTRLGIGEVSLDANGNTRLLLGVYKNEAGATSNSSIQITHEIGGAKYATLSATPATSDNSTKIATTAFVKAQNYVTNSTLSSSPYLVLVGTSSTAGDATAKIVEISTSYETTPTISAGQILIVTPTTTSTVADSTITIQKTVSGTTTTLLTAKTMRYNNANITTGTDSIVWSANIPSIFMYDGTYWQFLGHGLDNNTTYSAMSVSEGTTGTATSSRVMRADYLKQIIEGLAISQTNTYYDSASSTLYIG